MANVLKLWCYEEITINNIEENKPEKLNLLLKVSSRVNNQHFAKFPFSGD